MNNRSKEDIARASAEIEARQKFDGTHAGLARQMDDESLAVYVREAIKRKQHDKDLAWHKLTVGGISDAALAICVNEANRRAREQHGKRVAARNGQ